MNLADKTNQSFNILKTSIDEVKRISQEIDSAMEEQKDANKTILQSIIKIKELGVQIKDNTKQEAIRGKQVEKNLENIIIMSQEIATSMEEQKIGLKEASTAAEHIRDISSKLKSISKKMEEDFNRFKTE